MESKEVVQVVVGPGHHDKLVIEVLQKAGIRVRSFHYWPHFERRENGQPVHKLWGGKAFDLMTFFSYALKSRLLEWFGYHWSMDHLFALYDKMVSRHLAFNGQPLIGWPQVSFYAFRKWKEQKGYCILEHPMIHVGEWTAVMKEAYQLLPQQKSGHSLFSPSMQRRMLKEYEMADKINVLSTYAYHTFIRHGVPKEKMVVTPLGIDTDFFTISAPAYPKEKFIFLFVGRLELLKGVHLLIAAFNSLQLPNAELWLVGDKRKEIESFIVGENVKWLGTKTREKLPALYNKAHCLVLPSLQESFGLVILEAMACGLPVIASNQTGAPDIIKEDYLGSVFQSGDQAHLALKMRHVYDHFTFDKQTIRAYIQQHFSLAGYRRKYMDVVAVHNNIEL